MNKTTGLMFGLFVAAAVLYVYYETSRRNSGVAAPSRMRKRLVIRLNSTGKTEARLSETPELDPQLAELLRASTQWYWLDSDEAFGRQFKGAFAPAEPTDNEATLRLLALTLAPDEAVTFEQGVLQRNRVFRELGERRCRIEVSPALAHSQVDLGSFRRYNP